jgi:hypothetical protein
LFASSLLVRAELFFEFFELSLKILVILFSFDSLDNLISTIIFIILVLLGEVFEVFKTKFLSFRLFKDIVFVFVVVNELAVNLLFLFLNVLSFFLFRVHNLLL